MPIPKIIHYCWLSGDPFPNDIAQYIHNWKQRLPDYQLMLWDQKQFDIHSVPWVERAVQTKKWAFAADYIRLYALYNYGGIYLDSDVEVLKPFDDLLARPYFIGFETNYPRIEAAVMGAQQGTPWIRDIMHFYESTSFHPEWPTLKIPILPEVLYSRLSENYQIKHTDNKEALSHLNQNEIGILSKEYFSPKNHKNGTIKIAKVTYTIHHFSNQWVPRSADFYVRLYSTLVKIPGYKKFHKRFITPCIDWFLLKFFTKNNYQ